MYFIGVSTSQSAAHRLFPRWVELAGEPSTNLLGLDIPVDAPREVYREAISTMLADPGCLGALVTTHKVGIYRHAADLFTQFDDDASLLGEVSCIVRRGDSLTGLGLDTVTSGLAVESVLAQATARVPAALILGAGGAGLALALYLSRQHPEIGVTLTDAAPARVEHVQNITALNCLLSDSGDGLVTALPADSLVVNATGMGKDRPGCPITDRTRFPSRALAWDFNYRGDLRFLDYARTQGALAIDGWEFFIHGWTQIMSHVLGFELTRERFAAMSKAACAIRAG
jgi:shikimate 5-dehydrogenase